MSKLAALLARLAEKQEAARRSTEESDEDSDSSQEECGEGGPSIYGSKRYWDDRYVDGTVGDSQVKGDLSNEWFVGYSAMQVALNEHLPRENKVVLLGTGLSLLGEEMMLDGYKLVDAIDYSEPCIKRMRNRQEKLEGLEKVGVNYQVMDVTQMEYKDESIPSVLDKATIDTMFNNEDNLKSVHSMLAETVRILEHDGLYVCLSYGDPDSRLELSSIPGGGGKYTQNPFETWNGEGISTSERKYFQAVAILALLILGHFHETSSLDILGGSRHISLSLEAPGKSVCVVRKARGFPARCFAARSYP
ncbi:hypothetical protein CYMTET_47627 [Cymbomonas tetramitiformis]|uniref:Methyltransferase type 11 domain-containing protein n=1 Tax=Cymbomonas tetramitiformis TaxID=36881 RepID=A0AAE0BTU3_9CHLO|nr:hypothetical protein CYMTET_47627 [Cymbomonas tetramitiformis]